MKIDHNKLMAEISGPSKFTREQFLNKCPGIIPECEQELNWWIEWWESHPDEKANAEIEFYEYLKQRDTEYFMFKLRLRLFLEEHSIRGIGDFYLRLEDKKITIRPIVPTEKLFIFKL